MKRPLIATLTVGICFAAIGHAQAQFEEMARRVPSSANTIMLFDVGKVFESPMAQAGNWQGEYANAFASGLVVLPPDTRRFLSATQMDFEFMQPIWNVAMLNLTRDASLATAASKLGGRLDEVGGFPAVSLPSDTYIIEFEKRLVGAMSPANRQKLGRWLADSQTAATVSLSPYLREALGFADKVGTPIVIAMDMQYVLTVPQIRELLDSIQALEHHKTVDRDKLAQVLASMRGATLGITMSQKPYGKIKIDFEQDASIMAGFAKPMLLEVLANQGATVEDFDTWTPKVSGTTVSIEGYLTDSGMRRIMSVMDAPMSFAQAQAQQGGDDGQQQAKVTAQATKAYFGKVTSLFDDLAGKKGSAQHINQYGVWFDRYAQKVDRLPMLNVDSEMLDYGQYIGSQFRNAAAAVKGIGMRGRVRQVNTVANMDAVQPGWSGNAYGGVRYGRYGAYGGGGGYAQWNNPANAMTANLQRQQTARTQVRAQEKYAGASSVQTIVGQMKETTTAVRRKMTEKYQIEF